MNKKEIKKKVDKGMVYSMVVVEIVGHPKAHVSKTLRLVVENMGKEEYVEIIKKDFFRPKKEKELYHAFVELEMLFKDPASLLVFCVDYAPSSVEIIDPQKITLSSGDASDLFNDLLAAIHKTGEQVRKTSAENKILSRNARNLLRNMIYMVLKKEPMKLAVLSKKVAIPEEQLESFLAIMIKEGKLKKEKEKYSLPS